MEIKQINGPIKCDEAIRCVFNLTTLDMKVYKKLQSTGPSRAIELAEQLNRERSTIYRSLQKLTKCGMCKKNTETLKHGGYYHIYQCQPLENIKKNALECLERWYQNVKNTISSLDEQ